MARIDLPNDQWAEVLDVDPDTFTAGQRKELLRAIDGSSGDTFDRGDAMLRKFIISWSYPVAADADGGLDAIPARAYDVLAEAAGEAIKAITVDVGPSPDPKADTSPTAA